MKVMYVRLPSLSFVRLNFVLRQKARRTQLATHESLKLLAHPAAVYEVSLFSLALQLEAWYSPLV